MSHHALKLKEFNHYLEQIAPEDGLFKTDVENLGAFRISTPHEKKREFYEPVLILVGQGEKNCFVGGKKVRYSAGHLLTMFLPTPAETEIINVSIEKPLLGAAIKVDLNRVAEILLRIEQAETTPPQSTAVGVSSIFSAPLNEDILDAMIRMFRTLGSQRDAAVMGNLIMDEIIYLLLCHEEGQGLRQRLQQSGQFRRISRAVDYLHRNIDKVVSVEQLAEMVHMSKTSFHENFREVMHMSPLQYAKSIKLYKAQLFIREGKSASEAGYLVGYNSPAQFSREYKRHFGYTPSATAV